MRKTLSERNLAVALFFLAFIVSVFAEQDAKRIEKTYTNAILISASPLPQALPKTISATHGYTKKIIGTSLLYAADGKENEKVVK